jgi:hypothetical protein
LFDIASDRHVIQCWLGTTHVAFQVIWVLRSAFSLPNLKRLEESDNSFWGDGTVEASGPTHGPTRGLPQASGPYRIMHFRVSAMLR